MIFKKENPVLNIDLTKKGIVLEVLETSSPHLTCEVCRRLKTEIIKITDNSCGYMGWICKDCMRKAVIKDADLISQNEWHQRRWEVLQKYQQELPEPYRTDICDILANGFPRSWVEKKLREQKGGNHES